MDKNKLKQVKQNTNINVVSGYCAKCLRKLSGDRIKDSENNEFCDEECRREYWQEIRREMYSNFREWRNGGR